MSKPFSREAVERVVGAVVAAGGYSIGPGGLEKNTSGGSMTLQEGAMYALGASSSPSLVVLTSVSEDTVKYKVWPFDGADRGLASWIARDLLSKGTATYLKMRGAQMAKFDPDLKRSMESLLKGGKGRKEKLSDYEPVTIHAEATIEGDLWYQAEAYGNVGSYTDDDGKTVYEISTQRRELDRVKADKNFKVVKVENRTKSAAVVTASVKPLYGHTDMNSAYLVEDYPYGRQLRCRIRYWLESSPSKGFRFVSQTEDPKTKRWNKPKASTYARISGCMFLDERDYVQWDGLSEYSDHDKCLDFVKKFPRADMSILKVWVGKKIAYYEATVAGKVKWQMNGQDIPQSEADAERARQDLAGWEAVKAAL